MRSYIALFGIIITSPNFFIQAHWKSRISKILNTITWSALMLKCRVVTLTVFRHMNSDWKLHMLDWLAWKAVAQPGGPQWKHAWCMMYVLETECHCTRSRKLLFWVLRPSYTNMQQNLKLFCRLCTRPRHMMHPIQTTPIKLNFVSLHRSIWYQHHRRFDRHISNASYLACLDWTTKRVPWGMECVALRSVRRLHSTTNDKILQC